MQTTKILLALFVILSIIFAALAAFEYTQTGPKTTTTTTTTTTTIQVSVITLTQTSGSSAPQTPPAVISIGGTAFTYSEWNSSTPDTFTISDVKFALWTNTTVTFTGGSCYGPVGDYGGYVITFPDGTTQTMTTCTAGIDTPISIRLSSHVDPQAGLLIDPSTESVYFLVSA
jgi:hypothetical protein